MQPHSQGKTVQCLSNHINSLDDNCKREILRIAELQADDYHMDRPLYYACRDDREHFCEKVVAGAGKIYKCLLKHKFEREMTLEVRLWGNVWSDKQDSFIINITK